MSEHCQWTRKILKRKLCGKDRETYDKKITVTVKRMLPLVVEVVVLEAMMAVEKN
jgi:hypothetical protein